MPNLLAKMSTGRKMVATVPKKAGINNRKMTCVERNITSILQNQADNTPLQSNQKPPNFFAHE